ncbi:MAG: hypothetical protein H6815_05535 [Phycisphaeraceae bacterium]|nr:hypothetical protein [Phycisphaerales bacterium]MCB9859900.1 hypothetical protein [Phycisphaeraceae bacterium]
MFRSSSAFEQHHKAVITSICLIALLAVILSVVGTAVWLVLIFLSCTTFVSIRLLKKSLIRSEDALLHNITPAVEQTFHELGTEGAIDRSTNVDGLSKVIRSIPPQVERIVGSYHQDHASVTRLNIMFEAINEPIVAIDSSGIVTNANEAALAFLAFKSNRPVRSIVGMPIENVLTKADLLDVVARASTGTSSERQIAFARDNITRLVHVRAVPLDANGHDASQRPSRSGVLLTMRDVTSLASANQVKTDFVANASHELRTPIATIQSAAETLGSIENLPPETRARMVNVIQAHAGRLEEIVRDLLDLSKLESPQLRVALGPFDLDEMRHRLHTLLEPRLLARHITLEYEFAPEFESLHTDPMLLMLVMKNLVENAVKFAHKETAVRVVGHVGSKSDITHDRVTESMDNIAPAPIPYPNGRTAIIEVIDSGIGIPIDQQQRIFERFYQVDSARTGATGDRGSGLGLAIVKHAVRTLGGRVRAESVWKQGTRMIVELPSALPPA